MLESEALADKQRLRGEQGKALDELAEETENLGLEFKWAKPSVKR